MWDFFVLLQPKNRAVRFACLGMPLTIILFLDKKQTRENIREPVD